MKKIIFLQDYSGPETNYRTHAKGTPVVFSDPFADRLISDGVAKEFTEPKPAKKAKNEEA